MSDDTNANMSDDTNADEEISVHITFTDGSKSERYTFKRSVLQEIISDFSYVLKNGSSGSFGTGAYEATTKNGHKFLLALRFAEVRMISREDNTR